ncbi:glutamyl-tRNA(Gln) amidotransferase, B subunit [Thermanaerovibrio acidaminovorans DSM 6589]|uniref:Aspartyl/glutamyl-tRNA(Asn/Gln) amidotransferase subunit B n=1 Tax=Thermanaerovibrio acidaminovorans (strain ATCC 49978 / DSM 6589 / Su883) TaxID=525903 RepID=D1B5Q5_THEAS|nr:Asp-tRNA(Asn)/Glu-tRNA(Gln) amidotransferase subunit GatB [Thermanaerovibrio acidaminovorans]ACZ19346.1 glutamyl-tRNA(Gln) amidotransferase, B subunit [Thermanaerovibrio acidaminovorans DSM 6589]
MRRVVIGLEVHVQVSTETKLFCSCPVDYIGARPNSNVCPTCLGLPGALPVPNRAAVESAYLTALALNCQVNLRTRFHRKNYFYPDLPKGYQISQYDLPIGVNGWIDLESGRRVRIQRLHLEEDAGKLVHGASDGRLGGSSYSLVDYNRSGVPLMEIVSMPDICSPGDAREYVTRLRRLVRYLGVSDGDMEDGSLRVDANVSLAEEGAPLGTKVEIKNLNSLRALERALEYEVLRQGEALDRGERILQETRHWDDVQGVTLGSRGKEEAHDYRYFPDPDLPPVEVSERTVERISRSMPELPWAKEARFAGDYGIGGDDLQVLLERRDVAEYFQTAVERGCRPRSAATWVRMELIPNMDPREGMGSIHVLPEDLALLDMKVIKGELSPGAVKLILKRMLDDRCGVEDAIRLCGISGRISGEDLARLVDRVLQENASVVEEIRSGMDKKGAKERFLQGQVMRLAKGQADPAQVGSLIKERLTGE